MNRDRLTILQREVLYDLYNSGKDIKGNPLSFEHRKEVEQLILEDARMDPDFNEEAFLKRKNFFRGYYFTEKEILGKGYERSKPLTRMQRRLLQKNIRAFAKINPKFMNKLRLVSWEAGKRNLLNEN